MTDADIAKCVMLVDELKETNRDDGGKFTAGASQPTVESVEPERSAETTAKTVGTSADKVKKCRYIDKYATDEIKEAAIIQVKNFKKQKSQLRLLLQEKTRKRIGFK